jgi:hypothetical protein
LLVCRPERTLVVQELDPPAARFLSALESDLCLGIAAAQYGIADDAALGRVIAMALELRLLAVPATP